MFETQESKPWYQSLPGVIVASVLLPPVGIVLLWMRRGSPIFVKAPGHGRDSASWVPAMFFSSPRGVARHRTKLTTPSSSNTGHNSKASLPSNPSLKIPSQSGPGSSGGQPGSGSCLRPRDKELLDQLSWTKPRRPL